MMGMFDDINDYRKREQSLDKPEGLDVTQLGAGDIVMLSRCKCTGDRSWIDNIWEIVATTRSHVAVKWSGVGPKPFWNEPRIVVVGEREFYDGREMYNALREAA